MQYAVCVFQPPLASYAFFPPFQNNGMAMRDESQDHNLILKLEFQWHFPSHFGSLISKDILKSFILTKNRKLIFRGNFKRYRNLFKTLMQKSLIYSLK